MLLCCKEHLLIFRQILRQNTGQKTQPLFVRLIPVRDRHTSFRSLGTLACLVRFACVLKYGIQGFKERSFQTEMLTNFGIDDNVRCHYILVIQIVHNKLLGRLQILDSLARNGKVTENVKKCIHAQRLITQSRRCFDTAFPGSKLRTFEPFTADGLTGDRLGPALQKMIDFLLCVALAVSGIRSRQFVNHFCAALKRCKVRNHRIPVMLGQRCGIFTAMFHKFTGTHNRVQTLFRAVLFLHRLQVNLRQNVRQLVLRILAFRVKADTGNLHGSFFLAVIETGQTHDSGLVDTHRVTLKVLYKLGLNHTKTLHLCGAVHEPVDVQRFLRFHNHGRRERKGIHLFLLFLKAAVIHLHKLCVNS